MKIALVTDGIYPYVMGGMQKHSYFLAKFLAKKGIEVDLYHYHFHNHNQKQSPFTHEELKFINIIRVPYPETIRFPGHYLYQRYLYSKKISDILLKRPLPDFIYAKGFSGWHLIRHKKKYIPEVPIGVNFHGYEMFQKWPDILTGLKLQILKWPVRYHVKKADYLFSYGGKISEIIKKLGGKSKIIEIPAGIGSDWIKNESEIKNNKKRKFIFVGRAERRKGIKEINETINKLLAYNFEFHFVGPLQPKLQLKTKNVFYHGSIQEQENLKSILDEMDILVCPSYSEGMPNVIMEGMARGLAIIATDVGSVNMMVGNSNGWLIKNNIRDELVQNIKNAITLKDTSLKEKKINSIQKVRNHFIWEEVINKTIKNIQNCQLS